MLYILAGPDGAGKSTAFEGLKLLLPNAVFVKESHTSSITERFDRVCKAEKLLKSGQTVIYDRATILDDFIYQPITDGEESQLYRSNALTVLNQATIVYFDCETSLLTKRLAARGDEYIKETDLPRIKNAYESFFKKHALEIYRIDTSIPPVAVQTHLFQIVARKTFKLAHIVPVNSLENTMKKGYHMCLANLVVKSAEYAKHFIHLTESGRHWVLMDNGAAEGDQLTIHELIKCCECVRPNELVLPDTLKDSKDTLFKSKDALQELKRYYPYKMPFSLMAVPQGATLEEWKECAELMVQWPDIRTIGVPKHLTSISEHARIMAVQHIGKLMKKYNRYELEVHLLGCNEPPMVIESIHNVFPFVRGCDSAYAYICTQAGVSIYSDTTRPAGEIDFINGSSHAGLKENMLALEIETGVYDNGFDHTWV